MAQDIPTKPVAKPVPPARGLTLPCAVTPSNNMVFDYAGDTLLITANEDSEGRKAQIALSMRSVHELRTFLRVFALRAAYRMD